MLYFCYKNSVLKLPENNPIAGLSRGLAEAWKLYGNEKLVKITSTDICENFFNLFWQEYCFLFQQVLPDLHQVFRKCPSFWERG